MSKNKCQMCHCAEPTCEATRGECTLQVCPECKDKYEQGQVYNKIQPLIEALCRELNGGDKKRIVKAFLAAFNREHRSLQSEVFQLLWLFFHDYSDQDKDKFFDGRNGHCQGMAKKWYESM